MPIVNVKGTDQQIKFPDDMTPEQILDVMRNQYRPPDYGAALRNNSYAAPYNPTLTERIGSGISNTLYDAGIISDRYGANRIGENLADLVGVLPGIGDAMGGDDFGRALKQGDAAGIGMGALAAVPVVGDAVNAKMFRGVGAGSDDSLIKWMTPNEELAKGYASAREGGTVLSENVNLKNVADLGRDALREKPSSLISKVVKDSLDKGLADKSKAKEARARFLNHFGNEPIDVIDLWKDQESKEVTADLLKALGYDSLKIKEGGVDTFGLIGESSDDIAKQLPMGGKPITDWYQLMDYTPEQLALQAKLSDPDNVTNGVYTIDKGKFRTEFYDDGTSAIIRAGESEPLRVFNQDETKDNLKNKIIEAEARRPEVAEYEAKKQAAREAAQAPKEDTYKMQHRAPLLEDGNSAGFNLSDTFGEDIYSPRAVDYFGHGVPYDRKAVNIIRQMKDNPDKTVTIYRSVPKDVKEINAGDWVTTTREYARDHMEGEKNWHILSKKVKAKDIATDGNSIHEWGYDP